MSTDTQAAFTIQKMFTDLENDGIELDASIIEKAKNGDGDSIYHIGWTYNFKKEQYDKAMIWYRLASIKNSSSGHHGIGYLYSKGLGVFPDQLTALEWYIRAAVQNQPIACSNIGLFFDYGTEIPVDKYKAYEWFYKSGRNQDRIKFLIKQGIVFKEEDKNKPLEQLIMETENVLLEEKKKRDGKIREDMVAFRKLKIRLEKEIPAKDEQIKTMQQEINDQRESVEWHEKREKDLTNEVRTLKEKIRKLEARDCKNNLSENDSELPASTEVTSSNSTTKRIQELEMINQNLQDQLEREQRLKDNEMELIKQHVEVLSEMVKQKKNELDIGNGELNSIETATQRMTTLNDDPSLASSYDNSSTNEEDNHRSWDTEHFNKRAESDDMIDRIECVDPNNSDFNINNDK